MTQQPQGSNHEAQQHRVCCGHQQPQTIQQHSPDGNSSRQHHGRHCSYMWLFRQIDLTGLLPTQLTSLNRIYRHCLCEGKAPDRLLAVLIRWAQL